jgi:glycosyltransferase involved in cell wall biosynthesis
MAGVEAQFDGYVQAAALPEIYGSAKVLMFPSRGDAWGLVANEAVLCGTPVLASPHAVSSHELVQPFEVGLVRPLDVQAWTEAAMAMLSSPERWAQFMQRRDQAVEWFSLEKSLAGFTRAVALARCPRETAASAPQAT